MKKRRPRPVTKLKNIDKITPKRRKRQIGVRIWVAEHGKTEVVPVPVTQE